MTKYLIIGCRYNGTTSLEQYLKDKGENVKRDESMFDRPGGFEDYYFNWRDWVPVIIVSEKKEHLFDFPYLFKKWAGVKPEIYRLETISKDPKFPKLNEGSTLQGSFHEEHRKHLNEI